MKVLSKIARFFHYIRLNIVYWRACMAANRQYRITGRNQFVLPCIDDAVVVIDRRAYRQHMEAAGMPVIGNADFYRECFYCALWRDNRPLNKIGRKAKRQMFLRYYLR